MEENIGYSAEEPEPISSPRWQHQDEYMLEKRQSSQEFMQYKSYHLHLKRKREGPPEFKNFPPSYWERLSFYRSYINSPNKVQILTFYSQDFNQRIWTMMMGFIFGGLPYTYVHVFLATYVPETPLFLEKMVPFMEVKGISISIILAAIIELFTYVANGVHVLDFLFNAIFSKNPWNECPEKGFFKHGYVDVYCYHLDNIAEKIKNKTVIFDKMYYLIVEDNIKFQFCQIQYYSIRRFIMSNWLILFYGILIWTIVVLCYGKIYFRWIWKVLHFSHNGTLAYFVISYAYHCIYNVGDKIPDIDFKLDPTTEFFPGMHFNVFSLSLIAPPVYHIVNARTSDQIHPSRDSTVIVLSNLMYSLLRLLATAKSKHYMETIAQLPLYMPAGSHLSTWYIYYPLYFSLFYFGDLFSLLFFLQLFITEIITCIIHLELTLDIVINKWKTLPRRITGLVLITIAVISNSIQRYFNWSLILVMFFNKLSLTAMEVIVIFWVYPVFRLADDISFHEGYPVHLWRFFCMISAPFVYLFVSFKSLRTCLVQMMPTAFGKSMRSSMMVAFPAVGIPVVAGMCYSYYKYVFKGRRSWKHMFAPAEDWGPKDYVVRQLRKDYDSRVYTHSEVSRSLSRHIFAKTERKAYDLDISYDPNRRSTQIGYELKGTEHV